MVAIISQAAEAFRDDNERQIARACFCTEAKALGWLPGWGAALGRPNGRR